MAGSIAELARTSVARDFRAMPINQSARPRRGSPAILCHSGRSSRLRCQSTRPAWRRGDIGRTSSGESTRTVYRW